MNEGDRWDDYTIPVESRESRVFHMGHRLLKLPAENSWVACGRFGYWSRPFTLVGTPLCSVCRKAIEAVKRRGQAKAKAKEA